MASDEHIATQQEDRSYLTRSSSREIQDVEAASDEEPVDASETAGDDDVLFVPL